MQEQFNNAQIDGFQTPDAIHAGAPDTIPQEGWIDEQGLRHFPDGSILAGENLDQHAPNMMNIDEHDQNLAEILEEPILSAIGNHLKQEIENDRESQRPFFEAVANIIRLLGIDAGDIEKRGDDGITKIYSSALFETLLDYTATIMNSILPSKGPVSCVILGETNQELEDIAYRKAAFFNDYLMNNDKGFEKELKRTVVWAILAGSIYTKVYIDQILGRPTMRMIKPQDFIVNRDISSHLAASRKTQRHHIDKREFELRKLVGEYRDISILPTSFNPETDNPIKEQTDVISGYDADAIQGSGDANQYELFECHVDYRIKEDPFAKDVDIPLPYIITLDSATARILRIQRNWNKGDFLKKKREYFVNFSLLPSLDGEGYGLVQYAGKSSEAATDLTNHLMVAAEYANFPGGVYQAGVRLDNNNLRPAPGEFLPIQTGGVPLSQAIQPLPYREPSPALNELKNQLEDNIRKPSAIINHKIAEMVPQAPMGSVLAMLESMQKVPNFVVQGFHQSFKEMLELFNARFYEWLPNDKPYPFIVPGGSHVIMRSDFEANIQVSPANDPSLQNAMYRFMRAEIILNNARQNPELHDLRFANQYFYKNLGLSEEDIKKILQPEQPPQEVQPLDPITENAHLLMGKPVKAGIEQDHDAHMLVHQSLTQDQTANQDPAVMGAIQAHIKEHAALKLLVQFQMNTGIQLPQDQAQIPQDMQNQIAVAAAQMVQQQGQQQQEQQSQTPEMLQAQAMVIEAQAKQTEVHVKELQANLNADLGQRKLLLEQQRLELQLQKLKNEQELKEKAMFDKKIIETEKIAIEKAKAQANILKDSQDFAQAVHP